MYSYILIQLYFIISIMFIFYKIRNEEVEFGISFLFLVIFSTFFWYILFLSITVYLVIKMRNTSFENNPGGIITIGVLTAFPGLYLIFNYSYLFLGFIE